MNDHVCKPSCHNPCLLDATELRSGGPMAATVDKVTGDLNVKCQHCGDGVLVVSQFVAAIRRACESAAIERWNIGLQPVEKMQTDFERHMCQELGL